MDIPGKCLIGATSDVVDACKMIRIMIRLPDDGTPTGLNDGDITGWLAMHDGDDDVDSAAMHWMENVLPQNPHIESILHTPAPCRFDWSDEKGDFVRTE